MKEIGVWLTTSESATFQLMGSAEFPQFKQIQNLYKVKPPYSGLEYSNPQGKL
jgi:hypothetical protein